MMSGLIQAIKDFSRMDWWKGVFASSRKKNDFSEGFVLEIYRPGEEWIVKVNDVYWRALSVSETDLSPGDRIQVIRQENIKLLISPLP